MSFFFSIELMISKSKVMIVDSFDKLISLKSLKKSFPEPNADANGALSAPYLVNDIALLELEEELDLKVYTPICLARTGLTEAGMTMLSSKLSLIDVLKQE